MAIIKTQWFKNNRSINFRTKSNDFFSRKEFEASDDTTKLTRDLETKEEMENE